MIRQKVVRFPAVVADHIFEKLRAIDMTLAEFEQLLGTGEVIEEEWRPNSQLAEIVLVLDSRLPLHVVVIVDEQREEERIVTVYEPDPGLWSPDYRRRRR